MTITDNISWKEVSLGDCVSTLKGYAFKSQWYVSEGTPIIKVSDFTKDSVNENGLTYIPKNIGSKYSSYAMKKNDVVIQTVGSWPSNPDSVVGKAIRIPEKLDGALLNQNSVRVKPLSGIDNLFLFFLLKDYRYHDYIVGCAQGAASQAAITLSSIKSYKFLLPPVIVQRKIGGLLYQIDSLIAYNQAKIELLEEMAQLLYREWFVEFRFPGYEETKFKDSELGKVPEGWKVITVGDMASCIRGKSYRSEDISEGEEGVPFVNLKSIRIDGGYRLDGLKWFVGESKDSQRVKKGDIIVAITEVSPAREIIARAGQIPTLPNDYGVFSMDLVKIKPTEEKQRQYVYRTLRSYEYAEQVKMYANGANVLHLNPEKILHHPCLLPEESVVEKFCEIDQALFELSDLLILQNQNLQEQKDMLLPKLMSGEIDVSKLDINVTKN